MTNRCLLSLQTLALSALLCAAARPCTAEIRLPHALSDHAVLQRDRPIHLWGWASPGAHLQATFHQQTVDTTANPLGEWSLYLRPESAGGPYTLTVSGDGAPKQLHDLLTGDVWLASGQSNMEFPLRGFSGAPLKNQAQEIAAATRPRIRLLRVDHRSSAFPLNDVSGVWTECTPATAADFSAVAYFFGAEIEAHENVPVGLIDSTWGGTPADSWVSLDTLGTDPRLLPAFASRAHFADHQTNLQSTVAAEQRQDAEDQRAGRPVHPHPWHPDPTSWSPAGLYNGMIAPLAPLEIRGFLWYQGETNSSPDRAPYYRDLFAALIGDWRRHFAQGNLPFVYAQISSFDSPQESWGTVRNAQREALDLADTAMAVTLDVGEVHNVHPADKQTAGRRLALAARRLAYGESLTASGPMIRQVTTEQMPDGTTSLRVWFDDATGLQLKPAEGTSFEVAAEDGIFKPVHARVEGETVLLWATQVAHPTQVRFAWDNVVEQNLYNAAGLPAPTFRAATARAR